MPIIGGHVSTAGGLANAILRAQNIGAQTIQIFGASPRQWQAKLPEQEKFDAFIKAQRAAKIGPVFLHAAYLVNLASAEPFIFNGSVKSLTDHLKIADGINAQGLIFHPGSAKNTTRQAALSQVVKGMKAVLAKVPGPTQLIIENTAGGGQKIGATLEDLAWLHQQMDDNRIKICLDTAHALESGLIEAYEPKNIKALFDDFDRLIGLKHLGVMHLNDSKTPTRSHHDRHANIGEGYIGLKGFKYLAQEKRINALPWLLEVPGFDDTGPDKENIELLKTVL